MKLLLTLLLTTLISRSSAQEISGRIFDEKKEPAINASIKVYMGGIYKGGSVTDYDGNYAIKPLDPGRYEVLILVDGYDSVMTTDVIVSMGRSTNINARLTKSEGVRKCIMTAYKVRLVHDKPVLTGCGGGIEMPTTNVIDLVSSSNAYQRKKESTCGGGGRGQGTIYVIDGIEVTGNPEIQIVTCECQTSEPYLLNYTLTREDLSRLPATHINDYAGFFPGVYQARRGDAPIIYGGGNQYLMDGVIINR